MLLFVLACGLSVTLGRMNFINLAHGSFAMAGGYCTVILVNRMGVPFALGLPLAFLVTAVLGGLLAHADVHVYARTISTRCYSPSASCSCRWRPPITSWALRSNRYRSRMCSRANSTCSASAWADIAPFIIVICGALTVALQLILAKTRVRQPVARGGGRSACGARAWHQCRRGVRYHLRIRLRACRGCGGARRRNPRPRSRPSRSNTSSTS